MGISFGVSKPDCLRVTCKFTMVHESAKRVFEIYGDDWRFVPNGPGNPTNERQGFSLGFLGFRIHFSAKSLGDFWGMCKGSIA